MKKFKIFIVAMFLFNISAFSQEQDVVYLKSGSIIRGSLKSYENGKCMIETKDKSLWVFQSEEVEKITKETPPKKTIWFRNEGYYMYSSLNFFHNDYQWGATSINPSLRIVNGYQFNKYFALGLGIATERYWREKVIPITLDARCYIRESRTTPYFSLLGGYSLPTDNSKLFLSEEWRKKGGIQTGLSLGLRHFITTGIALDVSVGYKFQRFTRRDWSNRWEDSREKITYISHHYSPYFSVGLLFN